MPHKHYFIGLLLALLIINLPGCGFQLRTAPAWPALLQPVATDSIPQGRDFVLLLRRTLSEQGVTLNGQAVARIVVVDEQHKRQVQSLDNQGRVNVYQLNYEVTLKLDDADGEPLVEAEPYRFQRSYAYDPAQALGNQWQEQQMIKRMRQQAIERFMQRVALSHLAGVAK